MTNLNGITGIGVGLNTNLPQRESQPELREEAPNNAPQVKSSEPNFIPGDDVMSVLAQQASLNRSTIAGAKTYDVAKYVTPEQAKRIAGFVTGFEDIVAKNLAGINAEFGGALSDTAKMNIALAAAEEKVV